MRNQKEKVESQKKIHKGICVRDMTFMAARSHSYISFCRFFRLLRSYVKKKEFCFFILLTSAIGTIPTKNYDVYRKTLATLKSVT